MNRSEMKTSGKRHQQQFEWARWFFEVHIVFHEVAGKNYYKMMCICPLRLFLSYLSKHGRP